VCLLDTRRLSGGTWCVPLVLGQCRRGGAFELRPTRAGPSLVFGTMPRGQGPSLVFGTMPPLAGPSVGFLGNAYVVGPCVGLWDYAYVGRALRRSLGHCWRGFICDSVLVVTLWSRLLHIDRALCPEPSFSEVSVFLWNHSKYFSFLCYLLFK